MVSAVAQCNVRHSPTKKFGHPPFPFPSTHSSSCPHSPPPPVPVPLATHCTSFVAHLAVTQGTPLDFRKSKPLGQDISKVENGYDHCFVIDREDKAADELAFVARASDPVSGRVLEVYSTGKAREGFWGGAPLCMTIYLQHHGANKRRLCLWRLAHAHGPRCPPFSNPEPSVQLYTGGFLAGEVGREGTVRMVCVCQKSLYILSRPTPLIRWLPCQFCSLICSTRAFALRRSTFRTA